MEQQFEKVGERKSTDDNPVSVKLIDVLSQESKEACSD